MDLAGTYIGEAKQQSSNIATRLPKYKSKGVGADYLEKRSHEGGSFDHSYMIHGLLNHLIKKLEPQY